MKVNLYRVLGIDSRDVVMMEQLLGLDGADRSVIEGYIYEDKLKGQKLKDKIFHYCMDILAKQFIEDMIKLADDENNYGLESALRAAYYEIHDDIMMRIGDEYIDKDIIMVYYMNGYEEEAYKAVVKKFEKRG